MTDAFLAAAGAQLRVALGRTMSFVTGALTPALFAVLLLAPRRAEITPAVATSALCGIVLASLWSASLWSAMGILRRERSDGTLARTMTSVRPPMAVLIGKICGALLLDVVLVVSSTATVFAVLQVPVRIAHPVAFAAGALAAVIGGVCASLLVGTALVISRYGFQITSALGPPVLLLGGLLVPLSALPAWAGWLGNALNLRWVQEFLASTAVGPVRWAALGPALGLSAAYAAAGVRLLHTMLVRARKEATLELA